MVITSIIDDCTDRTIEQWLQRYLDAIPKPQRLQKVQELLLAVSETDGLVAEIASKAWNYIVTHRLWESKYSSLEAFKESIAYDITVDDVLKRQEVLSLRHQAEARGILANWKSLPHDALPPELRPPKLSKDLLAFLNRLSKVCPLDKAITLLRAQVAQRLSLAAGKRLKSYPKPHIIPADVLHVWEQMKPLTSCPDNQLEQSWAAETARSYDDQINEATLANGVQTSYSQGSSQLQVKAQAARRRHEVDESSNGQIGENTEDNAAEDKATDQEEDVDMDDEGVSEAVKRIDVAPEADDSLSATIITTVNTMNGEDNDNEDDMEEITDLDEEEEEQNSYVQTSITRPKRTADKKDDADERTRKKPRPDDCSCPVRARKFVASFVLSLETPHQGAALASLRETTPFELLCRNHLRLFAGNALDMVNNITTTALLKRLEWIYHRKRQMVTVRQVRPSWFRGQSGNVWRVTPPVFDKGERENFHFDAARVFDRFAGHGSWDRWLQDGTLILPGIFDHLRRVQTEIHNEFDMYAFHLGKQPGLPTMGWMRNMYHSGPQQLMYQDPILWALTAAARADEHWRLIAYPYNAKNAAASQKAGFLHLDLDLKRHQSEGLGRNMVQSSVSLTDENDQGCTLVVPGFHKRFQDWVRTKRDLIDSKASRRSTTDMKSMYTAKDKVRFGRPVPAPCPAWGIRLSRSDIIHGSTDEGTQLRRVMFPWFTAIHDDHKSMENPDCMNWEDLSSCHKDLVGPIKESLGDQPRKGVAGVRFPGAIPVRSAYSLPLALVGLKEWTEPDVIFERNILLGPDDDRALELAENIRKQLVDTYKLLYPLMEVRERQAFGDQSSFAENDVAREGDEGIGLDEDSE